MGGLLNWVLGGSNWSCFLSNSSKWNSYTETPRRFATLLAATFWLMAPSCSDAGRVGGCGWCGWCGGDICKSRLVKVKYPSSAQCLMNVSIFLLRFVLPRSLLCQFQRPNPGVFACLLDQALARARFSPLLVYGKASGELRSRPVGLKQLLLLHLTLGKCYP